MAMVKGTYLEMYSVQLVEHIYFFYKCIVSFGFLPWEIWVAFPGKTQLQKALIQNLHFDLFYLLLGNTYLEKASSFNLCALGSVPKPLDKKILRKKGGGGGPLQACAVKEKDCGVLKFSYQLGQHFHSCLPDI